MMSPLRGSLVYTMTVLTADAVGYCYIAPPGLCVRFLLYFNSTSIGFSLGRL